jgi:FKBP-type peptidyl-prolyl cis-trans isomerase 2
MKKIEKTSKVTVHYTGKLEDGSVFDTSLSEGRDPLVAKLGEGQLIPGFESGLLDMTVGDKRTVEIEPANAYGEYQDFMLQEVPLENLPSDVEVGAMLQAETQMGLINFVVKEIKESTAILDANHPLAGQKLIFDLEVLEVE